MHFADLGNWVHQALRCRYPSKLHYSHTTSSPFPSPTYDSPSLSHLHIQGGHLHQLSHVFFSLFLLKSNEKVVEASSALYFWDHHTPIQIVAKPTEALDTALLYH